VFGEGIGLDDQRRPWPAEIALQGDGDEISATHLRPAPAVDVGQSGVQELAQARVGQVSLSGETGLSAAFLGEARASRIGNPDLNRAQPRLTERGAPLADTRNGRRRHGL
jgi:hypothetical protein